MMPFFLSFFSILECESLWQHKMAFMSCHHGICMYTRYRPTIHALWGCGGHMTVNIILPKARGQPAPVGWLPEIR